MPDNEAAPGKQGASPPTRWSIVISAQGDSMCALESSAAAIGSHAGLFNAADKADIALARAAPSSANRPPPQCGRWTQCGIQPATPATGRVNLGGVPLAVASLDLPDAVLDRIEPRLLGIISGAAGC